MMPHARGGSPTKKEIEEICLLGGIAPSRSDQFWEAVRRAVSQYRQEKGKRSVGAAEKELKSLLKRVESTLKFSQQETYREKELRRRVAYVGKRFCGLSEEAQELLSLQHLEICTTLPDPAKAASVPAPVINPAAYATLDEQLFALRDLYGVLETELVPKRPGRPTMYLERILHCWIAAAYALATGRAPSDSNAVFMALADQIQECFKLSQWNPESMARSLRRDRANNDRSGLD